MSSRDSQSRTGRNRFIMLVLAMGVCVVALAAIVSGLAYDYLHAPSASSSTTSPTASQACQEAAKAANPVVAENTCPGTNSWRPDHPAGPENAIEAFTTPASVNVGGTVKMYVSTTAASYTFQVYRMGWYQGLGGHLLYSSLPLRGINQPAPTIDPATRMVSCSNWHNPVVLAIPTTWVSGVYIVKLLSSKGYIRYTSFVVRNDANHAQILFQSSILTYQAYNNWGGYSLYIGRDSATGEDVSVDRAYVVSFDRPYNKNEGLSDFVSYEYNLLRWMEQQGYNLSYITDIDTDLYPALLLHHPLILIAGHDEYWSTTMREHITTARDLGVSLAFFGADDVFWHVRLQSSPLGSDREVICYKVAALDPMTALDPKMATYLWREKPINEPENALLGQMYRSIVTGQAPLVLAAGIAPFLQGTHLQVGSSLPGLVGGEFDRIFNNGATPSSLSVLAASPVKCAVSPACSSGMETANTTLYTAPGGAKVFDAGTFDWGWGLDNDTFDPKAPPHVYSNPGFERLTTNLLTYLLA